LHHLHTIQNATAKGTEGRMDGRSTDMSTLSNVDYDL